MRSNGWCRSIYYDNVPVVQEHLYFDKTDSGMGSGRRAGFLGDGSSGRITLPVLLCIWKAECTCSCVICGRGIIVEENVLWYN